MGTAHAAAMTRVTSERDTKAADVVRLETMLDAARREIDSATSNGSTLMSDLERTSQQLQTAQAETLAAIAAHNRASLEWATERGTLLESMAKLDATASATASRLESALSTANGNVTRLEAALTSAKHDTANALAAGNALKSELDRARAAGDATATSQANVVARLTAERDARIAEQTRLDALLATTRSDLESTTTNAAQQQRGLERAMSELQAVRSQLEAQLDGSEATVSALRVELDRARASANADAAQHASDIQLLDTELQVPSSIPTSTTLLAYRYSFDKSELGTT